MDYICMFFNECIDQGNFPFVPKHASTMPVFNEAYRDSVDNVKNFRVSILTHFMEKPISKYQCGFCKGFNAKFYILGMLQK